jgi:hypothetical protein
MNPGEVLKICTKNAVCLKFTHLEKAGLSLHNCFTLDYCQGNDKRQAERKAPEQVWPNVAENPSIAG